MLDYKSFLRVYNPWWSSGQLQPKLPLFHRILFSTLLDDLDTLPQILSITGPRRVGKSTLLHQLIQKLLLDGINQERLIYYSFDDPALASRRVSGAELLEKVMEDALVQDRSGAGPKTYLFLDEIQRFERWELYLKKYYDLKFPVRVVISGSASSPIFRKSRESLLGRVKDYRLLPFSFREYALFNLQGSPAQISEVEHIHQMGSAMEQMLSGVPEVSIPKSVMGDLAIAEVLDSLLARYFLEGGFPEVWELPTWPAKAEYLYDNQVKKVLYEDLGLAAEFRKPELLKRFYISLLERPGQEVSIQKVAAQTEVQVAQIEKYLPLLEMTDLVYSLTRFRSSPLRVRRGMMKFYLVDLALRNAVLRLTQESLTDPATLGLYAENAVFLALRKWRASIQLDYYRDRSGEIDFIAHLGSSKYLAVEVKYQNQISSEDSLPLRRFRSKPGRQVFGWIVCKNWSDLAFHDDILTLPLSYFLLMFD